MIYLLPFVVSAILALLYETKVLRLNRSFYGFALLVLSLFAGLRFEVGQDWDAYEAFFERLNINNNIRDIYANSNQQFEIGYYALNYLVKSLGGTYHWVFLIVALFGAYSTYMFTRHYSINRFYFLAIYISNTFIILNFAQVRQAVAIGFVILGCDQYLRSHNRVSALLVASIGLAFQISCLMYMVPLAVVLFWPERMRKAWLVAILCGSGVGLYICSVYVDFYSMLAFVATTSTAQEKIEIYKDAQTMQGPWLRVYAAYLLLLIYYFTKYLPHVKREQVFIVRLAISSIGMAIVFIIIFPGSYVMYSRAYVVAEFFQAYAAAIIFTSTKKVWQHYAIFALTLLASGISYYRLIYLYRDYYLPYKSILSLL